MKGKKNINEAGDGKIELQKVSCCLTEERKHLQLKSEEGETCIGGGGGNPQLL